MPCRPSTSLLELSSRDPERNSPDPPQRVPDRRSPADRLGEGFGDRVVSEIRIPRERIHRSPETSSVFPIEPLESADWVLVRIAHPHILHPSRHEFAKKR